MSWFKRSGERKSASPSPSRSDTDPNTCREVFQNHWKQACSVILCQDKKATVNGQATVDGVELVLHHLEQMITLLVSEDDDGGVPGPILHYVLESDLLESFCNWCTLNIPCHERLRFQQLRLFELIISQSHQMLLIHKPVIKPLLKLLIDVADSRDDSNGELEFKLVLVLHQICICISQQGLILESFFSTDTDHGPARFLIFSLLIPFTYREGPVGQKARDALLLIMTLSARHPHIGKYIANNSHFCPVLATGLSGLYSLLPRRLTPPSEDWYAITKEDCVRIPDLQMFINSLQFSNAVVQVAHPLVRDQLIEYIYTGFLLPVLAPALHQDIPGLPMSLLDTDLFRISREEVMTATAYLDLFIRHVTDPYLLKAALKFVLTEKYDDALILDSLISRLSSNTYLSTVTLALFHTLIELNCEDVMFQLVFRYLVPCTHVMVSQRRSVRDLDLYGKSAEKFLSLRPSCCTSQGQPSSTPTSTTLPASSNPSTHASMTSSNTPGHSHLEGNKNANAIPNASINTNAKTNAAGETSYLEYLQEARTQVEQVARACHNWTYPYDGESPAPDSLTHSNEQAADSSVREEAKTGFLEVGSMPAVRSESVEKDVDIGLKFEPPVNSTTTTSGNDSVFVASSDMEESSVSDEGAAEDDAGGLSTGVDPKLYASLSDLNTFIEYLSVNDSAFESSIDEMMLTDSVTNSLMSLDDAMTSVLKGHGGNSALRSSSAVAGSDGECTMDLSPLDMSAINPVNSTALSHHVTAQSQDAGFGDVSRLTAGETPAKGDSPVSADDRLSGRTLSTTAPGDKTSFEEISMSEVPKDLPVTLKTQHLKADASSFINISVVPSEAATATPARPSILSVGSLSNNPRVPRELKKGFSQGSASLYASSILSPACSHGDGLSQFRMMRSPLIEELPVFTPTSPKRNLKYTNDPPNIGPFLSALFSRLEGMIGNSLYFNLLLTGILSQLSSYPQPLLRSFLLNHNLVFQPSVKSLIQVLSSLRQKLESFSLTVKSFTDLIVKARVNLLTREDQLYKVVEPSPLTNAVSSVVPQHQQQQQQPARQRAETIQVVPSTNKERKKLTIGDLFRRSGKDKITGKGSKNMPQLQRVEVGGRSGYMYINQHQASARHGGGGGEMMSPQGAGFYNASTWNAIYCALVLDEFLKELAALSQEQSVLSLDEGYLSS